MKVVCCVDSYHSGVVDFEYALCRLDPGAAWRPGPKASNMLLTLKSHIIIPVIRLCTHVLGHPGTMYPTLSLLTKSP